MPQVTKKRPEDAPREGYTLQAEAFATLAALGLVANFEGARGAGSIRVFGLPGLPWSTTQLHAAFCFAEPHKLCCLEQNGDGQDCWQGKVMRAAC